MGEFTIPKPDCFEGQRDYIIVQGFVASLPGYLHFHGVDDQGRMSVRYASLFLKGSAQTWFHGLPADPTDGLPVNLGSLTEFETALVSQFRPSDHIERVRAKLRSARQRGADVGRYVDYMDDLFMQLGGEIADSEKLDRFKSGLTGRERDFVYFSRPSTYEDAKQVALSLAGSNQPAAAPTTSGRVVVLAGSPLFPIRCATHTPAFRRVVKGSSPETHLESPFLAAQWTTCSIELRQLCATSNNSFKPRFPPPLFLNNE